MYPFRVSRSIRRQDQVAGQVAGQVAAEVMKILKTISGEMTRTEIQSVLDLKGRANFEERYLKPALSQGLVEMTIPNKPKSRMQRHRLIDAGKHLLKSMQE